MAAPRRAHDGRGWRPPVVVRLAAAVAATAAAAAVATAAAVAAAAAVGTAAGAPAVATGGGGVVRQAAAVFVAKGHRRPSAWAPSRDRGRSRTPRSAADATPAPTATAEARAEATEAAPLTAGPPSQEGGRRGGNGRGNGGRGNGGRGNGGGDNGGRGNGGRGNGGRGNGGDDNGGDDNGGDDSDRGDDGGGDGDGDGVGGDEDPYWFGRGFDRCTAANRRTRTEVRQLSRAERSAYTSTVRTLIDTGGYAHFTWLHQQHRRTAHGGAHFLPWHRLFVLEFEEALRAINPDVAVPYCTFGGGVSAAACGVVVSVHWGVRTLSLCGLLL